MNAPRLTRREFAAALGGIVVSFSLTDRPLLAQQTAQRRPPLPGSLNNNRMLDAWLRIHPDGAATVFTGKVELGQGIVTALAQIAAEELDLPLDRITMVSGDTGRTPDEGQTAGSQSIEASGTALRFAGAEARAILLELAAERLGTDALAASDGVITAPDGRKLTYGDLASSVDLRREATGKVAPRPPAEHKIVGKPVPRRDIPVKVTGGVAYVQDLRLPGMLHGRIVRPPRYDAKLVGYDAAVQAMAGVRAVVRDGSFLGVIADREEQAIKARAALMRSAQWSGGRELPDPAKIYEYLLSLPTDDKVISDKQAPLPDGAQTLEATYHRPYMAHASIGPSCALAQFEDGKLTVWTHTQGVFPLRGTLATALDMPAASIRCIHSQGSGCYGHNAADDVALDAALLARAMPGRPVRVQWMRDDEFKWEPYGAAMVMRAKAALKDGRIVDWNYDVWSNTHNMRPGDPDGVNLLASWYLERPKKPGPPRALPQPAGGGDRNAIALYELPRQHVVSHLIKDMPLRVSALRTLGAYANVFAIESFMDELAAAAGADPVAFRLAHLKDPRAKAVLEAAAAAADWKPGRGGTGAGTPAHGRGVAFAKYKTLATYVAVVVDVEVDRDSGTVKVPRVFAAADSGQIINPNGLQNQIDGGIVQSTSWTLHEEVGFDRNGITAQDWETYPILTMKEAPKVTTVLIDRPNEPSLGAGEASQGPTSAAIANAFAAATGRRIRDLPFHPGRVKAVLA